MKEVELFFGLPIDKTLERELKEVDEAVLSIFIRPEEAYLQEATLQGKRFLGKSIGTAVDFNHLELLETNIYSLLKRILPNYPFPKTSLTLFASESIL